jgi:simple sugar transport system permease protein
VTDEQQTPPEPAPRSRLLERLAPANLDWRSVLLLPVLAVVAALAVGAVIIALTEGPGQILAAYSALLSGAFGGVSPISETLISAAPVILAGLAVALGFRAGLFNIGAEGQMVVGGVAAVIVGFSVTGLPAVVHLPLALLGAVAAGAIWGGVPGLLRAKTGAHEVITTIMLNAIAVNLLNYLLRRPSIQRSGRADPISKDVLDSARLPQLLGWIDPQLRVHLGFVVALLLAWFVYWLLFKSTIGFEFRAVGLSPSAANYAGMSVTRVTVVVMATAGAIAGIGGANLTLGELGRASPGFVGGAGFDSIALALLGRSHPAGVVLAGLLFGALRAGGRTMQAQTAVGIDLITIVQALVIVFIAAPELVRAIFRVRTGGKLERVTTGWSA